RQRTIYLLTLLSPMSMPSLRSSPWIRGAPQPGFSRDILRIRSQTSLEMTGRPGFPQRTFQVQNKRKAARCQATTVSGLTMANAERCRVELPFFYYRHRFLREPMTAVLDNTDVLGVHIPFCLNCNFNQCTRG